MSLLNTLRQHLAPRKTNHPVFGQLRYQRVGFWEGAAHFEPIQCAVEVIVNAGTEGPSDEHQMFFRDLEKRYKDLEPILAKKLSETAREKQTNVAPNEVSHAFQLAAIEIPRHGAPESGWSLSYTCAVDGWHYQVSMKGWTAESVVAEC